MRVDRTRLARFGIPVGDVADMMETALNGIEATDVYKEDRITSVLIRLPEEYRNNQEAEKISRWTYRTGRGSPSQN